jgi:hypothetical protein
MIKNIFTFSLILFFEFSFAQNAFLPSGKVGIGTDNPISILDVRAPLASGSGFVSGQSHFSIKDNLGITRLNFQASNYNNTGEGNLTIFDTKGVQTFYIGNTGGIGDVMILSPGSRFTIGENVFLAKNFDMFVKGFSRFSKNTFFDDRVMLTGTPPVNNGTGPFPIPNIPTTAGSFDVSTYKLFVKGGILTEQIRVSLASTWADYVFKKDYKLPSLRAVEKHIQEKGHLINVPSASEIAASGINLGEMSKIQQEKIEELTLYIIEQNKINEKQAKEIAELKALVKKIAARK